MRRRLRTRPLVVVVDDNRADADFIRHVVDQHEWRIDVEVITDGQEAIDRLVDDDAALPDLVLLDINMPVRSGHEVLAEVRRRWPAAILPIVMLTTSGADHDIHRALGAGATAYVVKPHEADEAIDAVQTLLRFWLYQARAAPFIGDRRAAVTAQGRRRRRRDAVVRR